MEIQTIKQNLSILTVLERYSLSPDKGKRINCPFHQDKTPSMQVYAETDTVFCFSSNCKLNGKAIDQIDFIMHKEECSKHEALKKATELAEEESGAVQTPNLGVSTPLQKEEEKPNLEILSKTFAYFRNGFISRNNNKGRNYLKNRSLDVDKLENLGVSFGYNSAQFHHRGRINQTEIKECEKAGLLIKSNNNGKTGTTYTTWASHCVIFPLTNENGMITGMYGRNVIENGELKIENEKQGKHYYLKNSKGLFHHPKKDTKTLIITESIIDFLTLYQIDGLREQYGFLPIYGTNRLTAEHKQAINKLENLEEIIFFLDGDKAGNEAVKKYSTELKNENPAITISKIDTPENEDINSLLEAHDLEIYAHLIEGRINLFPSSEVTNESRTDARPCVSIEPETPPSGNSPFSILNSPLNVKNPDYILFTTPNLHFAILGGINLNQLDRMRVTLKISTMSNKEDVQAALNGSPEHTIRHNIDLYNDDQLEKFVAKASEKLETASTTIAKAVNELIDKLESYRLSKIESKKEQKPKARQLSPERKKKAINYLKRSDLIKKTNEDIDKTGVTGEENNRMLMYLIFTSRLREQPLHIISLGASGTGKTYLQEKIAELIPETEKMEITILSENAFYYFEQKELRNKLVLIEDMDGAENVLYPLRELQSKKRISKTVPIKDTKGNMKTITLKVEGPISLAGTTTRERLYEDNANRSILIYLDNSKEQQEKIMEYQRRLSAGKIDSKSEDEVKELFKDIQTVLKQIPVRNPYAEQLKIPDYVFKPLRTNAHYLAFIETITFYHQYQRELKKAENGTPYIETTTEDIAMANELIKDVLLAKSDELTKTLRSFFEGLKYHLKSTQTESFYAKELREKLRMNPMTINRYLRELEQHGYIRRAGGNRKKGYEYEITNWTDYADLQDNMKVLDEILEQIKAKENSENKEGDKYNMSITTPDVILNESQVAEN